MLNASGLADTPRAHHHAAHLEHTAVHHVHEAKHTAHARQLTPIQEINAQYAAFTAAYMNVLNKYVESLDEESTGTVPVSATVSAPYTAPSAIIQVIDASVFGTEGTFSAAVLATATLGTVKLGTFSVTGSASSVPGGPADLLIIDVTKSTATNLPVGTVLTANVPTSAQTSASSIFPSYITNSTLLMATSLEAYFNSLPVTLPPENTPPHTPTQRGAIQMYVHESIAGSSSTSLQTLLSDITLPTTPGPDLEIYEAAVASAIAQSHQQLVDGIEQIYNRSLLINATAPANRLGIIYNSGTTGGTASSTTSGSTGSSTSA